MDFFLFGLEIVCVLALVIAAIVGFIFVQVKARLVWRLLSIAVVLVASCWVSHFVTNAMVRLEFAEAYERGTLDFVRAIDQMDVDGRTNDVHQSCEKFLQVFDLSTDKRAVSVFNQFVQDTCALAYNPTNATSEPTNLICFSPRWNPDKIFSPLEIITTNTQVTAAVRLGGLWDYLFAADFVYLNSDDLAETIAQIKPVALRCAPVTKAGNGDVTVIIVDSRSTFTNTIGQADLCRLLQAIPPHVLQENELFNSNIEELKVYEGCGQTAAAKGPPGD